MCSPAGAGGYNKSSPGAGLCGTGFICCTQAAPPGASGYKIQPRGRFVWGWPPLLHPSRPHRGRVGTTNPAPGPVCVGLAASAAPKPPPQKPSNRPHRGRVGTKSSPGAGCVGLASSAAPKPPPPGAGVKNQPWSRVVSTQAAPPGASGYKKTQPWGRVVWDWPPLLHPSRPHRGRVGTKTHSPAASLCGTGCGAAAQKENDEEKKEKRMKTGSQDKVRRTGRTVLPLP